MAGKSFFSLCKQHRAQVRDAEAGVARLLGDAQPDRVALAEVHHAHRLGQEGVDVPLQDRLELRLHLAAGHLDEDGQRQAARPPARPLISGPDDADEPVLQPVHRAAGEVLEARVYLPPNSMARSSLRTRSPRRPGRAAPGMGISTVRILTPRTSTARDGMSRCGHVGDHVLVGADAAGQDLGDVGVGDDRKAEVDRAGGGRVLLVVHFAQRQHEGEDAPLVVEQYLARLLQTSRS